jgi:hypothetical protein
VASDPVCRLCSKPIPAGAHTLDLQGEAVHFACALGETRLQSLFLREEAEAIAGKLSATVQRAKAAVVPRVSILVGCLDSVGPAARRFVVGGISFEAAPGLDLGRLHPGAIVRVIYESRPGAHHATHIRALGVPR